MKLKDIIIFAVTLWAVAATLRGCMGHSDTQPPMRDTVIDTIKVVKPIARDSLVTRYKVETLRNVVDSIAIIEVDSLVLDTLQVRLPIVSKHYCDSTYDAWVSGYEPSLDSINVYQRILIKYKQPSRWSIGLQGGIGATPKGVQPYIGVGISYRLW